MKTTKTKGSELLFTSRFPPRLNLYFSVGIPVKREDASWCGHRKDMRESPTKTGFKYIYLRCEMKFFGSADYSFLYYGRLMRKCKSVYYTLLRKHFFFRIRIVVY